MAKTFTHLIVSEGVTANIASIIPAPKPAENEFFVSSRPNRERNAQTDPEDFVER